MPLIGKLRPAKCERSQGRKAMWFIKEVGMACSNCGRTREMSVPPEGLMAMPCQYSAGNEATSFATEETTSARTTDGIGEPAEPNKDRHAIQKGRRFASAFRGA